MSGRPLVFSRRAWQRALNAARDLSDLHGPLQQAARDLTQASAGALLLYGEDGALKVAHPFGLTDEALAFVRTAIGEAPLRDDVTWWTHPVPDDVDVAATPPPRHLLALPLRGGGRLLGMLALVTPGAKPSETLLAEGRDLAGRLGPVLDACRMRRALQEAQERDRRVVTSAGAAMYEVDFSTRRIYALGGVTGLLGEPEPERALPLRRWYRRLHPDDAPRCRASLEAAIAGRQPYRLRYRVRHRAGHYVVVEDHGNVVADADGAPQRIVGLMLNVERLSEAERAMREREVRYWALFESSGAAILELDPYSRRVLAVNAQFCRLSGFDRQEVIGRAHEELLHPEERAATDDRTHELLPGKPGVGEQERRYLRRDGTSFWGLMTATFLQDEADGALRCIAVIQDITERVEAETALRSSRRALQELNETLETEVEARTRQVRALGAALTLAEQRERRRIAYVLHDELQQVLFGLEMKTQLLRLDTASGRHGTDALLQDIQHLARQAVDATRTLSIELNPPVLRGEGLAEALGWLAAHMQRRHGLHVHVGAPVVPDRLGPDRQALLMQIVRELLFNVVKHAGVTEAEICTRRTADRFILAVEDAGKGFVVPAHGAERRPHQGMGLASIEERLQLLGGSLTITSAPGAGTTVELALPYETTGEALRAGPSSGR